MGLLSKLFVRPKPALAKAPRRTGVEPLEQRRLLAADVLLGGVYLEESLSGQDDNGDILRVSFVGGADGTTLDRLVIDGDKAGDGPSNADVFFDTIKGGTGSFEAVGLSIVESNGFTVDSFEVIDGGTSIAFNLTGFEAGEELVFSIDVDEFGISRGQLNSNAFAEGGEFEGSHLIGDFSAPGFVDLTLRGEYFDAFDPDFAAAQAAAGGVLTRLPGDDYDDPNDPDVPVRTAGAVAYAPQIELARLSGYVYHDQSDDGLKDASEDPIAGVTLELLNGSGVGTGVFTTTDADGYYEFIDLTAGTYGVRETQPTGWFDGKDTIGSNGGTVANDLLTGAVLQFGDRATDYNFGELLAGSIAGRVHASTDGDCDYDDPDLLLSGVTIQLLSATGVVLETTTTDDQGRYSFTGLRPGEYQVREQQPTGYYDGSERVGTAGGTLADDLISGIVLGSAEAATQYDFCEHVGADLSGYVYHDRSNDGSRDPGEEPIPQVTLKLLLADGTDTGQRAVTDANGFYQFTNLDRGTYCVMEVQPVAWLDGLDTPGTEGGSATNPGDMICEITLEFGDDAREYNFGELLPGSISGRVHASTDGDCDYDDPDLLLSGVTIELLDASGAVIDTTQTNALGEYRFEGLTPGSYSVREIQPAGYYDGSERIGSAGGVLSNDLISQIGVGSDVDAVQYDFCEHVGASLSGYVYHDASDDGVKDASEDPIAGVTLELLNGSGVGTGVFTTTNADGYYEFTNLTAGTYGVRETQPTGWFDGQDTIGSNGGSVANDLLTGAVLQFGDQATDYNFGELLAGSITGRVHAESDGDCVVDPGEVLLEGVVIELLDASGVVLATTTTDANGTYAFEGLRPGEYQVREVQPEGYYDGGELVGSAGGTATDDLISGILLGSEQRATDYNFCENIGADLAGYVYHDRSNDGVRDPGEEPIPQVTLKLLLADGTDTGQRAVTDANGFYQFTNLDRGTYCVMEVQPVAWLDGLDTPGTEGGSATNPGDMICEITLDFGDDAREYNFGELLPGSISGKVHSSPDGDCEDPINATPIAGVVIELLDDSGTVVATTTTDADGAYTFDGLTPGGYSVREVQPSGFFDGSDHLGSEGGLVSNDLFTEVMIGSGVDATDYDFCELPPAALSGHVFIDGPPLLSLNGALPEEIPSDRNGLRTADDTLLPGVTVQLVNGFNGLPFYRLQPGETEFDAPEGFAAFEALPGTYEDGDFTLLTDANGYYEFANLPSGAYAVVEVQPDGLFDWIDTPGTTGGDIGGPGGPDDRPAFLDSVFVPGDTISQILIAAGEHSRENNFSELDITPGQPPRETPDPPPPFVPPTLITPGTDPLLLPFTPPERPGEELFGGSSQAIGYTWHLSVINGGDPREQASDQAAVRFASQSTGDAWSGAERDAEELRKAKWRLLAADIEGDELNELLFGSADAIPVAGDWDGDGITDIGVFVAGDWYLDLDGDGRWGAGDLWAQLGSRDDLPVTGDWDGDGKDDIGIYGPAWPRDPHAIERDPGIPDVANHNGPLEGKAKNVPPTEEDATSGGRLLAKLRAKVAGRRTDVIDHVFHYGTPGDAPVVGDWNGDGVRTIGVFRDGAWSLDTNGDGRLDETDRQVALGGAGDRPIVGDYNGDGIDDLGVYRAGKWLVDANGDGVLEPLRLAATDDALADTGTGAPVVGDWDGDGRDEPALFTPAETAGESEPEVRVSQREAG